MESDAVLTLILKQIEEERQAIINALATGGIGDYAQYREKCGEIRGFGVSQRIVADVRARLRQE